MRTMSDPWKDTPDPGSARTARARPVRVRAGAPLRKRLTRPGTLPAPVPESAIAALAVFQGAHRELVDVMNRWSESPVLAAGTQVIPAEGYYVHNFDSLMQSVQLVNLSGTTLTLAPGGASDPARPPTMGAGVHQVPAGRAVVAGIQANALTVYGTPGATFGLTVLSRWVPPNATAGPNTNSGLFAPATLAAVGISPVFDTASLHDTWVMTTVVTGAPAAVTIALEGSLDQAMWYPLASSTAVAGEAVFGSGKPARYARANLTVLGAGAAPTVTAKFAASR